MASCCQRGRMETSLHKQLKLQYTDDEALTEVVVGDFRIDAIVPDGELVEIQHASLAALKKKTLRLLETPEHRLRIVKPILARKRVVTLTRKGGRVQRSRMSPKRGVLLDIFDDLVYFTSVFPKPRLTLEIALVEAEEVRVDRKRPTRRGKKYKTLDQQLTSVQKRIELKEASDLLEHLPIASLPSEFDTAELSSSIERPRWYAQKVAYCLHKTGAVTQAGKRGNAFLYKAAG